MSDTIEASVPVRTIEQVEQELKYAREAIARYEERERDTISAQSIFDEAMDDLDARETAEDKRDDMMDRAHEDVDGHQWVIYHYRAHQVCQCNTDLGEAFLEDTGMPETVTYDSLASLIAYGEMRGRVEARIQELVDEWVDERGGEDEEDASDDEESDDEEHTLGTPEGHAEIVREESAAPATTDADLADWEIDERAERIRNGEEPA